MGAMPLLHQPEFIAEDCSKFVVLGEDCRPKPRLQFAPLRRRELGHKRVAHRPKRCDIAEDIKMLSDSCSLCSFKEHFESGIDDRASLPGSTDRSQHRRSSTRAEHDGREPCAVGPFGVRIRPATRKKCRRCKHKLRVTKRTPRITDCHKGDRPLLILHQLESKKRGLGGGQPFPASGGCLIEHTWFPVRSADRLHLQNAEFHSDLEHFPLRIETNEPGIYTPTLIRKLTE